MPTPQPRLRRSIHTYQIPTLREPIMIPASTTFDWATIFGHNSVPVSSGTMPAPAIPVAETPAPLPPAPPRESLLDKYDSEGNIRTKFGNKFVLYYKDELTYCVLPDPYYSDGKLTLIPFSRIKEYFNDAALRNGYVSDSTTSAVSTKVPLRHIYTDEIRFVKSSLGFINNDDNTVMFAEVPIGGTGSRVTLGSCINVNGQTQFGDNAAMRAFRSSGFIDMLNGIYPSIESAWNTLTEQKIPTSHRGVAFHSNLALVRKQISLIQLQYKNEYVGEVSTTDPARFEGFQLYPSHDYLAKYVEAFAGFKPKVFDVN